MNTGLFGRVGVWEGKNSRSGKFGTPVYEQEVVRMLTNESSRTEFVSMLSGNLEITNESVKSFVLDKLFSIVTHKISKMDTDFQIILKSEGNYQKYQYFKHLDETIKELNDMIKNGKSDIDSNNISQINDIFQAHSNLIIHSKTFQDAFKFNIGTVKQYYLSIVASIAYSLGFIVSTMIDYEQRNRNVDYHIVFKNNNIMERGLPKNMMEVIRQFNSDIKDSTIVKTVNSQKNTKPSVKTEGVATIIATGTAIVVGLIALPAILRYVIYFFLHSKIKLAEYFEAQAAFLELNIKKVNTGNLKDKDKIIENQQKYIEKLLNFAAKLSSDKYATEKIVVKEIESEDIQVVKEADKEAKSSASNYDASDILL